MKPDTLLGLWRRLSVVPGGKWLFSRLLGRYVPYSGSIHACVEDLVPGRVTVRLVDRRRVRNHLGSIHAVALINLGELASGLALYTLLPAGLRGIVTGMEVQYLKKARGTLRANGYCRLPEVTGPTDHQVHADITDTSGDQIARVTVNWRLDLVPDS